MSKHPFVFKTEKIKGCEKGTLKDGQRRVAHDPKEVAYYIIEPRNPWVEKSEHYAKCENVTVYAVMKFKGYSFPKGSLDK